MRIRGLELAVGFFMLAGALALLVLALKVSGLTLSEGSRSYKVYALFENIGGLTSRSKVTMSGVKIGHVTAIVLDEDQLMARVEMAIDSNVNYLSLDSSASILTSGLLGEKYIGITTGADEEMLQDGDFIEDTQSALVLEELIGKFLFNEATE